MSSFDPQQRQLQDSLKRRWQQQQAERRSIAFPPNMMSPRPPPPSSLPFSIPPSSKSFPGIADDDLVSTVVPPVTVVLEGRSLCQRISLHKHGSYQSLAKALRQMFVDGSDATTTATTTAAAAAAGGGAVAEDDDLDLTNAIPGHLIAYEDMENDLLLAGDLNWRDFVRVAKRIRILPVKGNSRKGRGRA